MNREKLPCVFRGSKFTSYPRPPASLTAQRKDAGAEVLTNCIVNNVTDFKFLRGLPALIWGLRLGGAKKTGGNISAANSTAAVAAGLSVSVRVGAAKTERKMRRTMW